jgi:hypothetical protein
MTIILQSERKLVRRTFVLPDICLSFTGQAAFCCCYANCAPYGIHKTYFYVHMYYADR